MSTLVYEAGDFLRVTQSTQVISSSAAILGIFVTAITGNPLLGVYDSQTPGESRIILDDFAPAAGVFYPCPAVCRNGIWLEIIGTIDCTIFFQQR
jgi:hypothetical protein